jgi:hypothetical protein
MIPTSALALSNADFGRSHEDRPVMSPITSVAYHQPEQKQRRKSVEHSFGC